MKKIGKKYFIFASQCNFAVSMAIGLFFSIITMYGEIQTTSHENEVAKKFLIMAISISIVHIILVEMVSKFYITHPPENEYTRPKGVYCYVLIKEGRANIINSPVWGKGGKIITITKKEYLFFQGYFSTDKLVTESNLYYENKGEKLSIPIKIRYSLQDTEKIIKVLKDAQIERNNSISIDEYVENGFKNTLNLAEDEILKYIESLKSSSNLEYNFHLLQYKLKKIQQEKLGKIARNISVALGSPTLVEV